jgi:hypothetical protein
MKITEKRLYAVPPQAFTADGDQFGKITIADTTKFVVGHIVVLTSNTTTPTVLKVKRIISRTEMFVGPEKEPIQNRSDISAFLVADGAAVKAAEQPRPTIPEQEIERNTYAEEPTVARRVSLVDPMGDQYDYSNPIPVTVDTTVNIGDVRITAQDNDPNPGNQHSSVRISDGVDDLAINPDGSINVNFAASNAANPTIMNVLAPVANTEVSFQLPVLAKRFLIKTRTSASFKMSFQVGGTTTNYISLSSGSVYNEDGVVLSGPLDIYASTGKSGETIEVLYWT